VTSATFPSSLPAILNSPVILNSVPHVSDVGAAGRDSRL
jgi:hypothetical protein